MNIIETFSKIKKNLQLRLIIHRIIKNIAYFAILLLPFRFLEFIDISFSETNCFFIALSTILFSLIVFTLDIFKISRNNTPAHFAKRIEKEYPEFEDSLICATEKSLIPEEKRSFFENLLINKAIEQLQQINIYDVLIKKKYKTVNLVLFALLATILLFTTLNSIILDKAVNSLYEYFNYIETGILVKPGDSDIPIHSDITITAKVNRWNEKPRIIIYRNSRVFEYQMNKTSKQFSFTLYDVSENLKYKVLTNSLSSNKFNLKIYNPPKIEETKLTITPPKYTNLKPVSIKVFKDITAIEGANISLEVKTKKENKSANLFLSKNTMTQSLLMQKVANNSWKSNFDLLDNSKLSFQILNNENHLYKSSEINIIAIKDMPPVISLLSPQKDYKCLPKAEIPLKVIANDDFGIQSLSLSYSISGKKRQIIKIFSKGNSLTNELELNMEYLLKSLDIDAEVGSVISYFFIAEDIKVPNSQKARTEVAFIEIRETLKPKKMKGKGKKKELNIDALIAETKRIIRLSYDASYNIKQQKKIIKEIKPAINDLITETNKVCEKVRELGAKPELIDLFDLIVDNIQLAQNKILNLNFDEGISFEEQALAKLIKIAQALRNNTTSDSKSKDNQKGKGGKGKKGEGKKAEPKSIQESLEKILNLQQKISSLADRQGGQNNNLNQVSNEDITKLENKNLRDVQNNISKDTLNIANKLSDNFKSVKQMLENSNHKMELSQQALKSNNSIAAIRSGKDAHSMLLATANKLKEVKDKMIRNMLQQLANSANELSKQENSLSKDTQSQKNGQKKGSGKGLVDTQGEISKKTENLANYAKQFAQVLNKIYPKTAQSINASIKSIKDDKVQSYMKKATNALRYKRYSSAIKYQKSVIKSLENLSDNLNKAKDMLPKISQEQMLASLKKIQQAQSQVKAMKNNSASSKSSLRALQQGVMKELKQLGSNLNSNKMQELGMALNLSMSFDKELSLKSTENVLREAEKSLKEYIIRNSIKKLLELKRKTSTPPEEYQNKIDEYFKLLSE